MRFGFGALGFGGFGVEGLGSRVDCLGFGLVLARYKLHFEPSGYKDALWGFEL